MKISLILGLALYRPSQDLPSAEDAYQIRLSEIRLICIFFKKENIPERILFGKPETTPIIFLPTINLFFSRKSLFAAFCNQAPLSSLEEGGKKFSPW